MKQGFAAFGLIAALLLAVMASAAFAQDAQDTMPAHPLYARLQPRLHANIGTLATPLTTWNGSFVYKKHTYKYNMVGTAPSSGTSTTIRVFIIPVALSYTTNGKTVTFNPLSKLSNGLTAVQSTAQSPLFQTMDWVTPDGTDLGTTQYEDAFQRANFWSQVSSAPGYHVLLGQPRVAPLQKVSVPAADGMVGNEFGIRVGLADIDWFDLQLESILTKYESKITPGTLPIFITFNSYLTQGVCCIGGYHSSYGAASAPQAYIEFSYISTPGVFAQDVSALSHEAGEWLDDPLVVNTNGNAVACGVLEVGDPEERFTNYGAFPYTLNGSTYNLQDLVYLEYFGAPTTTSVDSGALSFHDNPFHLGICSNGG
ncbi:MAG TPA: hypothetical protein VMU61_17945 [Candidatus Aquilonibacter sp.]|nr:hypothetical protein [Candidatus Aquilonibacter sp.]